MIPESVPVFTKEDILISETEYEDTDGRRTTLGWLKELFLYEYIDEDRFVITADSRKFFREALDIFRKECKMGSSVSANEWEDKQSPTKLARLLNKTMRKLGYTEIEEI